jgi:site-specific recombinase XerD
MLHTHIEQFLRYCQVSNSSSKSIEALTLRLKQFKQFCHALSLSSISDITYQHLLTFIADYGSPSVHVKKNRVWALRHFYHFLKLNKIVDDNLAGEIPYPKVDRKVPKYLTAAEFNRILDYFTRQADAEFGLRNLIIIMLFGFLGLRLQAVLELNIDDVDLKSCLIWIRDKGGIKRHLPLPDILYKALAAYLEMPDLAAGPLFLSKRNKRLAERTVQDFLRTAMLELGIGKHLHAHLFRHTAATHINKVADSEVAQHVLGHASGQHTRHYTHLNPDVYAVFMKKHPYMNL